MTRLRLLVIALVGALTGVVFVATPAHAVEVTLSGTVRIWVDGPPAVGFTVRVYDTHTPNTYRVTTTDANGRYSLQVPQTDAATLTILDQTNGPTAGMTTTSLLPFDLSSSRMLDPLLPPAATLRVTVEFGAGGPKVAGAAVTASGVRSNTATTTEGGVSLVSSLPDPVCQTSATGVCDLRVLQGGTVSGLGVDPTSGPTQTFPGVPTPGGIISKTLTLGAYPVSGTLTDASGGPVAGASVAVLGSSTSSTTTGADGRWSSWVRAGGPYQVSVTTAVTTGGRTLPYEIESAPFQLDSARIIDLSVAALDMVRVDVRSSNGIAVDHPWVEVIGDLSTRTGTTPGGLSVTSYLNRGGKGGVVQCYPGSDGPCILPVISGGTSGRLQVVPPLPAQYFPAVPTVPGQPRVVQLTDYAVATSAGSHPGIVAGGVDHGDVPDFDTSTVTLPDGLDPVVGRIDYRATLEPGASGALFTVNLPDTNANSLFRQKPDGSLQLVSTWGGEPGFFDVIDGSAADADGEVNGSVSGNIIPVAMAPLRIATTEIPSAAQQKPYSTRLQGSGPGAPMVWSVDPNYPLPNGLTLSVDGVLSGTAPALGTYTFRVLMEDSRGWQGPATQQLTLRVDKVAVLTGSLPDAYIGGAYSSTLSFASGSFPSWSISSGSLPPGLKLGATNGTISGTPTTAGTYSFDVVVKANGNTSQRRTLSITVRPMEIATATLPDAPVWGAYSAKLTTRGGKATLVWSVAGGSLPPGVVLSSAGALSGKPTTVGSYPVTFTVKDALGQVATKSFVITVTPMTITTTSLPTAKKGGYYSQLLTVSGGKATLTWSLASGALPTGLTLSSAGRITGYPKAPGTWTFTVKVTDSSTPAATATRALSITVT